MNQRKPAYMIAMPIAVLLFIGGCIMIVSGKDMNALQTLGAIGLFASVPLMFVSLVSAIRTTVRKNKARKTDVTTSAPNRPASVATPEKAPETPAKAFVPPQERHGAFLSYSYNDVQIDWDPRNYEQIKAISPGTVLSFKRLDGGQVDIYHENMRIGGMRDNKLREMAFEFLKDPDRSAMAVFKSSSPLYLGLYFYSSGESVIGRLRRNADAMEYTLISNRNTEIQGNIEICSVGDYVSIDWDIDKEKFSVSANGLDIGFMPAGYKEYLEIHGTVTGRISEIKEPEDDDDKYRVSVIVTPKE